VVEATSLQREKEEQRRWRLRPKYADYRMHDRLLENEFLDPEEIASLQERALYDVLSHAGQAVPFYRAYFERIGLRLEAGEALAALRRLPALSKHVVQRNEKALCATALPSNDERFGWFQSSGTTGRPTRVLHSRRSNVMFSRLAQRQFRWFRWDPLRLRGELRPNYRQPLLSDGSHPAKGAASSYPRWRYIGEVFESGPQVGLCSTAPVERQLEWLLDQRPAYLTANSSVLDRLAWTAGEAQLGGILNGALAISEELSPSMRERCETALKARVDQNYGLNEIGITALRCAAGRYHVHMEHCLAEIVDEDGNPVPPGAVGRLLVTALRNPAMPLLRYETGDLAEAVEGPCLCGRTLPSFGALIGRFRQLVGLPEGTLARILKIKVTLREAPAEVVEMVRQFQIVQEADGSFRFLMVCSAPLPEDFGKLMAEAWQEVSGPDGPSLSLEVVEEIPLSASGKAQDFVSAFAPEG